MGIFADFRDKISTYKHIKKNLVKEKVALETFIYWI